MQKHKYTLNENLIIKNYLPNVGIVCSNPKRVQRIAQACLENPVLLTEYQSAWSMEIYVGKFQGKSVFIAAIAIGASGAAFAINEFKTAGAKVIIRLGSNDNPGLTKDDMYNVVLVDSADNLVGLMHGNGEDSSQWGKTFYATTEIINKLYKAYQDKQFSVAKARCHHVEDYAAYTFPHLHLNYESIQTNIDNLMQTDITKIHCRDMETAALYYLSQLDGFMAATVLLNVPKVAGKEQVYSGEIGEIAKQIEPEVAKVILEVINQYNSEDNKSIYLSYSILDPINIPNYLATIFDASYQHVNVVEIGDGNVNNVFRINKAKDSLIIKQAVPYLKCIGEEFALKLKRVKYEILYYRYVSKIYNKNIPQIYYADDRTMMLFCMQDLKDCIILSRAIITNNLPQNFANDIARFLAHTSFKTSTKYLNNIEHQELINQFNDNELINLTANFIFKFPYINHTTNYKNNNKIFSFKFKNNVNKLLDSFINQHEVLSHGDLHAGSIFVNQKDTYVIDSEFAFIGPIGFDLGLLCSSLIATYVYLNSGGKYNNVQEWILTTMNTVLNQFNSEFKNLWQQNPSVDMPFTSEEFEHYQNIYLTEKLQHTIGFAGVEICRRICGVAGFTYIRELADIDVKSKIETKLLHLGIYLVENYNNIHSIDAFIDKLNTLFKD